MTKNTSFSSVDSLYSKISKHLRDIEIEKLSLNEAISDGIISMADAEEEKRMISRKEFKLKKQAVDKIHVKSNGEPRTIGTHGPTPSYPNGYVYTRLPGENSPKKAATITDLYNKLYLHYFGRDLNQSIRHIFELALAEKQRTDNVSSNTVYKYKHDFDRFFDGIAERDICSITDNDLKEYTQMLVRSTAPSKKAFLSYKGVLNLIFLYAVRHKYIDQNPSASLNNSVYLKSCKKRTSSDKKIFSEDEIELIKTEARQSLKKKYTPNAYAVIFSILTGVRAGELVAMKWDDIDYRKAVIKIRRQQLIQIVDGKTTYFYEEGTKNEKGITSEGRLFPLSQDILSLLTEIKVVQMEHGIQSEFIFSKTDGAGVTTKSYETYLYKLCRRLGLKATNNHAFRMSLNSNVLIPLGIPVTERAKLLGHSVETNLRNYSFERRDYLETARNAFDQKGTVE